MKSKYWVCTQFCLEMIPKEVGRETLQERQRKFNRCHLCSEFPKVLCVLCLRDSTLSYRQLGNCFLSFLQLKECLLFQVSVTSVKFKSRLLEEHTPLQASCSAGCQMLVVYRVVKVVHSWEGGGGRRVRSWGSSSNLLFSRGNVRLCFQLDQPF